MMAQKTALLLVDYQQAFDDLGYWGARNNPDAEANAARVLAAFRAARLPIVHIVHDSTTPSSILAPGHPGNRQMSFALPFDGEPVIRKGVNSAFIGTDLEARLRALDVESLVIMGISTDHCVSTTTRMAANLGFAVTLVGDACFAFERRAMDGERFAAELVHKVELAILGAEFAAIASADAVVAGLI